MKFFIEKSNQASRSKQNSHKSIQVGHPASQFCEQAMGKSEIYTDKNNNEHDYCDFEGKYIIDSWNFFKRFKRNVKK